MPGYPAYPIGPGGSFLGPDNEGVEGQVAVLKAGRATEWADSLGGLDNVYEAPMVGDADTDRQTIQAAIDAANAAGGGTVRVSDPGKWDLNAVPHVYTAGKQMCLHLKDGVILQLGPMVTLQLADNQQTDADGAVDIVTGVDLKQAGVIGAGEELSKILGNTANQPGWTGGYSQQGINGAVINILYDSTGCEDLVFKRLTCGDHFSNCLNCAGFDVLQVNRRVLVKDFYGFDVGEGIQLASWEDAWMLNVHIKDASSVAVGDALEPASCERFGIIGFTVEGDTLGSRGSAVDPIASQNGVVSDGVIINWGNVFSPQTASGRHCENILFNNIVCRNIRGGTVCTEAPQGSVTYRNITIDNRDIAPNQCVPIQTNEPSDQPPMIYENVTAYNCNSFLIRGGRKIIMRGCANIDSGLEGLHLFRTTDEAPDLDLSDCSFRGAANYGLRVTGQGQEFKPTGMLRGIDLRDGGLGDLLLETGADFSNMECREFLPATRAQVPGSVQTVTGVEAQEITANLTALEGATDSQRATLLFRADDITVSNDAGTDGIVFASESDQIFHDRSSLTVRYEAMDQRWYEESRQVYEPGPLANLSRLFVAANQQSLENSVNNPDLSIGLRDWSICAWVYEDTITPPHYFVSKMGQLGWSLLASGFNYAFEYRDSTNSIRYAPNMVPRPGNAWHMLYVHHQMGVGMASAIGTAALETNDMTIGCNDPNGVFGFGRRVGNNDSWIDGRVAKVGIWHRTLTDLERSELFNGGLGLFANELSPGLVTNCVAYWNANEESGDCIGQIGGYNLTDLNGVGSAPGPGA